MSMLDEERRKMSKSKTPYLPHELVTEVLSWLPVKSLLRFRSVCRAWRGTISDDPSFIKTHLRRQQQVGPSSLLILPVMLEDDEEESIVGMGLYRWAPEPQQQPRGGGGGMAMIARKLMDIPPLPPPDMLVVHDVLAHCDGLVLVATRHHGVHLFNPAARQAVMLPWSPGGVAPRHAADRLPAYGLGRSRSSSYKVARFFYREVYVVATRTLGITTGMEVFTVGRDHRWRETAAQPTHAVLPERTATFYDGYLLWTIQEDEAEEEGFLHFSLDDETTFGVTPPPPYRADTRPVDYASAAITSSLSELRGELCVARLVAHHQVELELWMAVDAVHPRWEQRYAIPVARPRMALPLPVACFSNRHSKPIIVFHGYDGCLSLLGYQQGNADFNMIAQLQMLTYDDHPTTYFTNFFIVPYQESLVCIS